MLSKVLSVAACVLAVVNAAPGWQVPMTTQCTSRDLGQREFYPPVGKYLIGNVDSQGGLLFESLSGSALVDFRRTGGHGNRTLWEIRDAPNGESTIWNCTSNATPRFTDGGNLKATEFIVKSAGYPFFTFEAPVSRKLWDINYEGEPRYPDYAHLTLAKAPTDNDRISIFWQLKSPDFY
ncbi:hypothetical protein B0H13DRAFT_2325436 [Mycena leptocephala]|nr:hypothetical protein B0H13DRAFT_2325436 [Mycena leptocephala]